MFYVLLLFQGYKTKFRHARTKTKFFDKVDSFYLHTYSFTTVCWTVKWHHIPVRIPSLRSTTISITLLPVSTTVVSKDNPQVLKHWNKDKQHSTDWQILNLNVVLLELYHCLVVSWVCVKTLVIVNLSIFTDCIFITPSKMQSWQYMYHVSVMSPHPTIILQLLNISMITAKYLFILSLSVSLHSLQLQIFDNLSFTYVLLFGIEIFTGMKY